MINLNPQIAKMNAYKPPLDGRRNFDGLLLDFNERTIPISLKVGQALQDFTKNGCFQIYPEYFDFTAKIADYVGCEESQIMLVNGSDQGIDLVFRAFAESGDKALIPEPSFVMFKQCALLAGLELLTYDPALGLADLSPVEDYPKLFVICNPNNPTGQILSVLEIENILKQYPNSMVFVDEAYFEFSLITATKLIDDYPNLIISRTFSKAFGLAALRIGYLISQKQNLEQLFKVRGPYDVNSVAVAAASAALDDLEDLAKYRDEVMNEAKPLLEEFFRENGIKFLPSAANFLLFKPSDSKIVFETFRENGILVRPREEGTIRVSIGTLKQMKEFIKIYKSNFLL